MYNDYTHAAAIRAQLLAFYNGRFPAEKAAIIQSIRRDETFEADANTPVNALWELDASYQPIFERFHVTLTAAPGLVDPESPGFVADMTSAHLHWAARLYDLKVKVYSHNMGLYNQQVYNQGGTQPVALHHSGQHWEALVPVNQATAPQAPSHGVYISHNSLDRS